MILFFLIYYIDKMTDYKEKYLKYKNKYLSLKKQQVGSLGIDHLEGGVIKINKNGLNYTFMQETWNFVENHDKLNSINFIEQERNYIIDKFVKLILPKLLHLDPCIVEKDITFLNFGTNGAVISIGKYAIKIIKFNDDILPTIMHEIRSMKLIKDLLNGSPDNLKYFMKYHYSLLVDCDNIVETYNNTYNNTFDDNKMILHKNQKYNVISDDNLSILDDDNASDAASSDKRRRDSDVMITQEEINGLHLCFIISEKNDVGLFDEIINVMNNPELFMLLIKLFMKNAIGALLFLYDHQLIHFDLKIENYITDKNDNAITNIKLIDFATLLPFDKEKRKILDKIKFVTTTFAEKYNELKGDSIFSMVQIINPDYDWCSLYLEIKRLLSYTTVSFNDRYQEIYSILQAINDKPYGSYDPIDFNIQITQIRVLHQQL
jgi:serine/threonine protein kinase